MRHAISGTWRTEGNKIVAAQQRDTKKGHSILNEKKNPFSIGGNEKTP